MNRDLLIYVMSQHGDNCESLAKAFNISRQSLSRKMNENGTEFKKREIEFIKERYQLTAEKIDEIFLIKSIEKGYIGRANHGQVIIFQRSSGKIRNICFLFKKNPK